MKKYILIFMCLCRGAALFGHEKGQKDLEGPTLDMATFNDLQGRYRRFIETLNAKQKNRLVMPFDHAKRDRGFCYVLAHCKGDHSGLKMSEIVGKSRFELHQFLTRVMSSGGYLKFLAVMQRERLLEEMEDASRRFPKEFPAVGGSSDESWKTPLSRNYSDYTISFFGQLNKGHKWGMRLEGHHYSFSLTLDGRRMPVKLSATPVFYGVSPMVVPSPPLHDKQRYPIWNAMEGHHLLAAEVQLSREVISESGSQRTKAQWPSWPGPTLHGSLEQVPKKSDNSLKGIDLSTSSERLKNLVRQLLEEYLGSQRVTGVDRGSVLKDMQDHGKIFWKGDYQNPMTKFYIRIETGRYLFELLQNDLYSVSSEHDSNHIHSSLRDLKADWDHDRLAEHLEKYHRADSPKHWEGFTASDHAKGTVVIAHGSGGRQPWTNRWSTFLQKNGFNTLVIDSFSPRGYKHRQDVGWHKAVSDQSEDLSQAISYLRSKDPKKPIFLLGFSMGGYSTLKNFTDRKPYYKKVKPVAGAILFYAQCKDFVGSEQIANLLFIQGNKDERAPSRDCDWLIKMSPYKESQTLLVLEDATHGFDIEEFQKPVTLKGTEGVQHTMIYNPIAHLKVKKAVKDFLDGLVTGKK